MTGDAPEFVVLAIDPGAHSGWAVFENDSGPVRSGATDSAVERVAAIQWAQDRAAELGRHLVVVAESWTAGGWKNYKALIGLGASWGKWLHPLELAGIPEKNIVRVAPPTWRARLFNKANMKKNEAKKMAMTYACEPDPDIAEAVCIGFWAMWSIEVIDKAVQIERQARA